MERHSAIIEKHGAHFSKINEDLDKVLTSRVALIEDIGNHTLLGRGKRLRPLFFILSCRLCNYQKEDMYYLSTIFEYIHTASLLHDDVLDNADVRRNKPSANLIWGNHAAVLEGDFLYLKSSSIALSSNNLQFLKRIADATMQMTEGQILELIHTNNWDTTKREYMEIITAKTAVLISAACECGAIISDAGEDAGLCLGRFGMNMGIAFQLMDDLLDYISSEEVLGKAVGKDIREGKITLPLIYTLSNQREADRKRLENLFKDRRATDEDYHNLVNLVRENGVPDQIMDEAQSYVDKAAGCLSLFPDSRVKEDLLELNQYVIERNH